ncbi:hypothetical protein, partial [Bacteroides thetaiotaomicron]|uniref:hypothetical protein n=1 Tax=Bacteroides thetaiotaomicron TaxID=818 RepID=UPI0020C79C3C
MPHHQQKVNEKRYTTTGITPHRRSLPATGRLLSNTAPSFIGEMPSTCPPLTTLQTHTTMQTSDGMNYLKINP